MGSLNVLALNSGGSALNFGLSRVDATAAEAAMVAVLGSLDLLVFTVGIGENDAQLRAEVGAGLAWAGVSLDESRNHAASSASSRISDDTSRCPVLVFDSLENEQIARPAWGLLA